MVIKYCPKCSGRPYTSNIVEAECPVCHSALMVESVDENALSGRPQLPTTPSVAPGNNVDVIPQGNDNGVVNPFNASSAVAANSGEAYSNLSGKNQSNEIVGTVYGYSCSMDEAGNYRRLIITKIIDALFYGQRTEDTLHRFVVRPEDQSNVDIPVVIHGTMSASSGINNNSLVRVNGKYKHGTLYAKKIKVLNGAFESPVKFQINLSKILITIFAFLLLLAGTYLFIFQKSAVTGVIADVKSFLSIFAIVYIVLFFISALIISRSKLLITARFMLKKSNSIIMFVNLILSLLITFAIFKGLAGTGITLGLAMSAFGPVIIMVIGMIILLSALFK